MTIPDFVTSKAPASRLYRSGMQIDTHVRSSVIWPREKERNPYQKEWNTLHVSEHNRAPHIA
jgi:hypothetical protein